MIRGGVALAVVAALLAAGCGGDDTQATDLRVYWLRDGKVWPALREVDTAEPTDAALEELLAGPTEQEESELELTSAVPEDAELGDVTIEGGAAQVGLPENWPLDAMAQLVYTLTQFPTVRSVELTQGDDALTLTRADFEDLTPSVLVESPLSFEEVTSPLRATGTANTFEANFQYEVTDTDGRIVDENFVTATSGTGTRGTFDFTTGPFTVPFDGVGSLIVFESSAKDGSRVNIVEIPLRMKKE